MRFFSNLLLSRDAMGSPVTLNFRGKDSNPTKLGGLLTIAVQALVLFTLVRRCTSLISMEDPSILSFTRPVYVEEMDEYGEMKFSDYHFSVGVHVEYQRQGERGTLVLPEEFGRFVSEIKYLKEEADGTYLDSLFYPAVNCSDAFTLDTEPNRKTSGMIIPDGLCADRNNTVVKGS